jgi:hypothetical protein
MGGKNRWLTAVKRAFRSPSKEDSSSPQRKASRVQDDTSKDADEVSQIRSSVFRTRKRERERDKPRSLTHSLALVRCVAGEEGAAEVAVPALLVPVPGSPSGPARDGGAAPRHRAGGGDGGDGRGGGGHGAGGGGGGPPHQHHHRAARPPRRGRGDPDGVPRVPGPPRAARAQGPGEAAGAGAGPQRPEAGQHDAAVHAGAGQGAGARARPADAPRLLLLPRLLLHLPVRRGCCHRRAVRQQQVLLQRRHLRVLGLQLHPRLRRRPPIRRQY